MLIVAGLTACANAPERETKKWEVKDISADKMGYLQEKFSLESLSPDLRTHIFNQGGMTPNFKKMTLSYEETTEETDGKKRTVNVNATLINAGNGLVQEIRDVANVNGFPASTIFALDMRARLIVLKTQTAFLSKKTPEPIYEVKNAGVMDDVPAAPQENSKYAFETTSGDAGKYRAQLKCTTGKYFAASTLLKDFQGNAIEFKCQDYFNDVLSFQAKRVFLTQYRIFIQTELQNIHSKATYTYRGVSVE